MIVSHNELERTCAKAFRGLGIAPGAELDAARAVHWLASRGLDGTATIESALADLERGRHAVEVDGSGTCDGAGRSAVIVGAELVEEALRRVRSGDGAATVRVENLDAPRALLAHAVHAAPGEETIGITARSCLDSFDAVAVPGTGAWYRALGVPGSGATSELRVTRAPPGALIEALGGGRCLDPPALEARFADSLRAGIEVDDGLWARLVDAARRTLVPATEHSRTRGAGGGTYND